MRTIRFCFKASLVVLMFAYGLFAVAVLLPLLQVFSGRRGERLFAAIRLGWCRGLCRILGVRIEVTGTPAAEARLWVANHISWLDILVLGAQQSLIFVAKDEVASWPVLGYLARRVGTLFVRRGDAQQTAATAERMVWQLRQGKHLMLFPEGTTTNGDRVLRFHARLMRPAYLAQVSVQAIAIEYLGAAKAIAPFVGEDDFLTHLLSVLRLDALCLRLHYCDPLPAGLSSTTVAQTTHQQVLTSLFGEAVLRVGL